MEATIPDRPAGTVDGHGWPPRRIALGLILFAAGLRVPTLPLRRLVEGDGVHYAQLARAILAGDLSGLANPYWSNLWPAVIAIVAGATDLDVVAAGRLASLLSGVLLALLTAVLAARLFDPVTGLVAGPLCAVHPWLVHFSTLVFTESFFTFLLVALLLSAPAATAASGPPSAPASSAASRGDAARSLRRGRGRSHLDRGRRGGPARSRRVARRAAFRGLVPVFVFGRALVVHRYFGIWDFGSAPRGRRTCWWDSPITDREMERVTTEAAADGTNVLALRARKEVAAFARTHPARLARMWCAISDASPRARAGSSHPRPRRRSRPRGWGLGGRPLGRARPGRGGPGHGRAGAGRAGRPPGGSSPSSRPRVLTARVLRSSSTIACRALVPLFLVFLAAGLVRRRGDVLGRRANRHGGSRCGLAPLAVLSFARTLQSAPLDYAGDPIVQRETGEWLAARYGQDTRLMTAAPSVGFYFYDAATPTGGGAALGRRGPGPPSCARADVALLAAPEWHLRAPSIRRRPCCCIRTRPIPACATSRPSATTRGWPHVRVRGPAVPGPSRPAAVSRS